MKLSVSAVRPLINFFKPAPFFTAALLVITSITSANAGSIYVPNFSFESESTPFAAPIADHWQLPPQPQGFDTNIFGDWNNLAGVFANTSSTNADYISNANGNQLGYLFSYPQLALFQDYNSTDWTGAAPSHAFNAIYQPGKSYTLTVALTSSSEEELAPGATLLVSLYYRDAASNMVTVASTNVTFDTNVFTNLNQLVDFSVTVPVVNTNDAFAGKNIGIQFMSTTAPQYIGGVWDLDNVRLVENIYVPNFSFESQPTAFALPEADSWQVTAQPAGFDTNIFGLYSNLAGVFANTASTNSDYIINAVGSQLGYLFAYPQLGFFQDYNSTDWSGAPPTHAFNATFKPGKSYDLSVGLTSSSEEELNPGSTLLINLYYRDAASNMVTVASTTATFSTNVFTNLQQLVYFHATIPFIKATDAAAGKQIGIEFESTVSPFLIGGVWDLDNVQLEERVATVLTSPVKTNGVISFNVLSEPNLRFEILATTNLYTPLTNWTSIGTFTNATGSFPFTDSTVNLSQRFYRAHQLP